MKRAIDWDVSYSRFLRRNTVLLERSIDYFDVNERSTDQVVPRSVTQSCECQSSLLRVSEYLTNAAILIRYLSVFKVEMEIYSCTRFDY
jgi:hypothetical protein